MARLPDFTALGPTPAPQPPVSATPIDTRHADAPLSVSRALIGAGHEVNVGANELAVAQDHFDTLRAEDAFNQLRQKQIDLSVGPDGFATKKGGDAVNQPLYQNYTKQFDDSVSQIGGSLGNDQQKEKFQRRAEIAKLQYSQDLLKHVYNEGQTYATHVLNGTVETEVRNAQVNWQDPYAVQMSRDRIDMAIENISKQNGWPKEETEALRQKAFTEMTVGIISSAVANGDNQFAQDYYENHKDEVDKSTQNSLMTLVRNGKQKDLVNGYNSQFLAVRDSQKGLEDLLATVGKDQGLDEDRKNALMLKIMTRGDTVERRNQLLVKQRETTVQKGIDAVNANSLAGMPPSDDQIQPVIDAARGTDLQDQANAMLNLAKGVRQFRMLPPASQESYLNELEANVRKDPTKFDRNILNHLREVYNNQQKQISDDPVSFAQRQGIVDVPQLDLAHPENSLDALKVRASIARGLVGQYQAPFKILTKEEKDLLVGALKNTPVQQRRQFFGSYATALANDPEAYTAIMAQIAPDDPVSAIAGVYAGKGAKDDKGNQVADMILRGQAILHPNRKEDGQPDKGKLWPMPQGQDEKTMQQLFSDYENGAFAGHPKARSDHYQAALAIYAAKSADAGDSSGVIDSGRWKDSIKLATGGIEKYNGKAVVLPFGYEYGQFKDELRTRIDDIASGGKLDQAVTSSKLRDMPLESIGDGKYVFRAGDGVLVDKSNTPVVVDFSKPLSVPNGTKSTSQKATFKEWFAATGGVLMPGETQPQAIARWAKTRK